MKRIKICFFIILILLFSTFLIDKKNSFVKISTVSAQTQDVPWPMAGANPQRTSWVNSTLPDVISTQWVKPIYAYVPQRVQVIGAEGKVFVSTSQGLYAFDANTGADVWQYGTALPLGYSPTYSLENGVGYLYLPGLDKMIHKVRASTGAFVWKTTPVGGGYVTSPIVANNKIYATNRDGGLYAFNTSDGSQAWKFQTGNQINMSPAYMSEDDGISSTSQGTLYFASNDGYAYAVNAQSGIQVWKSANKLLSAGFSYWWPVIYGTDVIFSQSTFYEKNGVEANWFFGPTPTNGAVPGTVSFETQSGYWPVGEKIFDVSTNPNGYTFPDYFETQDASDTRPQHGPFRRNEFFFNRITGVERQFDLDNDGKPDGAPVAGLAKGGSHPPPVVSGYNNVLYFNSDYRGMDTSHAGVSIFGWKVGTPYVDVTVDTYRPGDEPMSISGAGDKLYWNHCCDRNIVGVNISRPNTDNINDPPREWYYTSGGGIDYFSWPLGVSGLPGSQADYYYIEAVKFFWNPQPSFSPPCCSAVFFNNNPAPPSIYNGRLYVIAGNALVALGAGGAGTNAPRLSSAPRISQPSLSFPTTSDQIRNRLEQEVSAMITAGHLTPSYLYSGNVSQSNYSRSIDEDLTQYWHNPADTFVVLLRALPFLSSTLQSQVKSYLQNEMVSYNPATIDNIGFANGTQRDPWPYPPLNGLSDNRLFNLPQAPSGNVSFDGWGFTPSNVYALWKYAAAGLGSPSTLMTQWGSRLHVPISANSTILTDQYLIDHPLVLNAYIAAYKGYVELAKLAGQTSSQWGPFDTEYNRLLSFRVANLTTFPNSAYSATHTRDYYQTMITYYNFAYMTPELAAYLRINARSSTADKDVLSILQKYQDIAPYWMQAHNGEMQGEDAIQPYQQEHAIFQALAQVKQSPQSELIKYLDTPIVPVGDLYYIDNLTAILEAPGGTSSTPSPVPIPGDINHDGTVNILDYTLLSNNFGTSNSSCDLNGDGTVNILDYTILSNNFGRTS